MSEWPLIRLGECLRAPPDYGANAAAVAFESGLPRYVRITDVADDGTLIHGTAVSVPRAFADGALLEEGDVLFARSGATVGKTYLYTPADGECAFAGYLIRFRTDSAKLLPEFLSRYTKSRAYWRWVARIAHAGAQPNISAQEYLDLPVPGLAIEEQEAIVRTVSPWECAQRKLAALIDAKRGFKRGLAQHLLMGKQRFKEFVRSPRFQETVAGPLPEDWGAKSLRGLFTPVTRRNTSGIGIVLTASGEHGLVNQRDYFSRSVAGDDLKGYYLLRKGEFAYNRSFMKGYPCGAIKRLEQYDEGTLSTLYICFALAAPGHDADFFAQVFEGGLLNRQLGQIIKVGARAHGLLNITAEDFYNVRVPVPSEPEQRAIAQLLSACDRELDLLERLRTALDQQRRGVAELLLTGKVRVPA